MTLLKITYLRKEDGTGTGPKVKPAQPQKQSLVSRFLPLFVCVSLLPSLLPMSQSPPEPRQWPLRQSCKLRQGHVGVIVFPIFSESPGERSGAQKKEVKGEGSGRVWESFYLSGSQKKTFHLDTA